MSEIITICGFCDGTAYRNCPICAKRCCPKHLGVFRHECYRVGEHNGKLVMNIKPHKNPEGESA